MSQRTRSSKKTPVALIDRRDLGLLGLLPALTVVAWLLPERAWPPLARRLAGARLALRGGRTGDELAKLRAVVGDRPLAQSVDACWHAHLAHNYHAWLQLLKCHRPGGWLPRVRLDGRAHLDAALAAGKGGILWVAPFAFTDLLTKLALHQAGHAVSHLSRDSHGFSDSRFGRRLLNPIQTRVEGRFLAERLVLSAGDTVRPLRQLAARLAENRLVSITIAGTGRQAQTVDFLGGQLQIAPGAPSLAWQTGAPLLPVTALLTPEGGFVTRIGPPLERPRDAARPTAIAAMIGAGARRLERDVLAAPDQVALPYIATVPSPAAGPTPPEAAAGPPTRPTSTGDR